MAYVYKHIRKDTNNVFYIGIGGDTKYQRSKSNKQRNKYWNNIVNKVGFISEIIEDNLTWEEACERERYWIKFYGRCDLNEGLLVNMTNGGDGAYGRISAMKGKYHTVDTINKIKNSMKGKHCGKSNPFYKHKHTELSLEKIKTALLGHDCSADVREKMSKSALALDNKRGNHHKAKKIQYLPTGKIYNCILDASDELHIRRITIQLQLIGKIKNLNFKFL